MYIINYTFGEGPETRDPAAKTMPAYHLRLANGQMWRLAAGEDAGPWLEKLAAVMELDRSPGGRKMPIRRRRGNGRPDIAARRRARGLNILRPSKGDGQEEITCRLRCGEEGEQYLQMFQSLYPIFYRAMASGGQPFHCGLVERDGRAALLAARCNTGKSTCCRRIPPPWNALSDDLALIVKDGAGNYRAHPLPTWSEYYRKRSEKTWDVQKHVGLSAIFFLEQSQDDKAVKMEKGQAAISIYRSAGEVLSPMLSRYNSRHGGREWSDLKTMILNSACGIARAVPAYTLRVSLGGNFWEEMDKALGQGPG